MTLNTLYSNARKVWRKTRELESGGMSSSHCFVR